MAGMIKVVGSLAVWLAAIVVLDRLDNVQGFCPSLCQCNDGLLEANCSTARLDSVPILLNPSLRSLDLSGNRIASLRQTVSIYIELKTLDLSRNSLHSLGVLHFQPLGQLEWLNVSNNLIGSVEMESFSGLGRLQVLDLSFNRLTKLSTGMFSELPSLGVLVLSGNKIETLESGAFDSLSKLHTLRLEDNNLGRVPSVALSDLSGSLRALFLAKNLIERLDERAFRHLTRLRLLALNDNRLDRIDPFAFDTLAELEVLDLSFNRLDGQLEGLPSTLKHLDLSGNAWRSLPARFLSGLTQLQTLNLSFMEYLRQVDPETLRLADDDHGGQAKSLPLAYLVMTNNALWNHFPPGLLDGLEPTLVRLDVSGNAFETLAPLSVGDQHQQHSVLVEERWPQLKQFNAAYNPLQCNCSLFWLWHLLHVNNHSEGPLTVTNVTCSGPIPFGGLPLSSLSQSDLHCSILLPVSVIVPLAVLSWVILTGILSASLVYWRRRRRKESSLIKAINNSGGTGYGYHHGTTPILAKQHHHHHQHHQPHRQHQSHLQPQMHFHQFQHPQQQQQQQQYQHHIYEGVGDQMLGVATGSNVSIPQYYQQHHHLLAPAGSRDEYTYHSGGTMKRIPVTVV